MGGLACLGFAWMTRTVSRASSAYRRENGAMQRTALTRLAEGGQPSRVRAILKGPGRHPMTTFAKPVAGALAFVFAAICGASAQEVKQDVGTQTVKPANITPVSQAM